MMDDQTLSSYRRSLCTGFVALYIAIGLTVDVGLAAEASPAAPEGSRTKLDRLLKCQQEEMDVALRDKAKVEAHYRDTQSFRETLADNPRYLQSINTTEQTLAKDRSTLEKIEQRIKLAELPLRMTQRAIQYLSPEEGGPKEASPLTDLPRRARNWRVDAENESRYLDGLFAEAYGFVADPVLVKRLESLVNRLQMMSARPDIPIKVKVLANDSGHGGAAATAAAVYFDKSYLDRSPSESELLFVAGHELAHVQLGHYGETLSEFEREEKNLSKPGNDVAELALGPRTKLRLAQRRMAHSSRESEQQADLLGAQQALEAGASPKGIYEAIMPMIEEHRAMIAGQPSVPPALQQHRESFASHPKPEDRLKALGAAFGEKFWERDRIPLSTCRR